MNKAVLIILGLITGFIVTLLSSILVSGCGYKGFPLEHYVSVTETEYLLTPVVFAMNLLFWAPFFIVLYLLITYFIKERANKKIFWGIITAVFVITAALGSVYFYYNTNGCATIRHWQESIRRGHDDTPRM